MARAPAVQLTVNPEPVIFVKERAVGGSGGAAAVVTARAADAGDEPAEFVAVTVTL